MTLTRSTKNNKTPDSIYGYTPEQLFFISFANNFRTKIREEAQKNYLRIDPHSPGYYRVNQSVRNMDEFHEAFNTTSEDSMFLSKERECIYGKFYKFKSNYKTNSL